MSKHWVKEEIHHSFLSDKVESFLLWVKANRQTAIVSGLALAAAVFFTIYVINGYQKIETTAWEKLFLAQQTAFRGDLEKSFKQVDELQKDFSRTSAAAYALLFKADVEFDSEKYKEAADDYSKLAESRKTAILIPFAISGIQSSLKALGDYKGAITAGQNFIEKYPDHFLLPQVYLALAQSFESAGQTDDAKKTYEKTLALFPDSYWGSTAKGVLTPKK